MTRTAALIVALALAGSVAVTGCGDEAESSADLQAVATTTHVADLLRNVGGDRVEVHSLLTPTSDPHEYEPRPSDAREVAEAALVVRAGGDLDEWLEDVVENAGGDAQELTLIDHVETQAGGHEHEEEEHAEEEEGEHAEEEEGEHAEEDEHAGEEDDPHWWQDPRNAVLAVEAIAEALAEVDPDGAAAYRANAAAYVEEIEALDRRIAGCMAALPEEQRKLVTTHDAYGYFAERYDIEVVGAVLPSRSTQARPSAGETAELVRQIRDEDVNAVFPESTLDPRLERAIAQEAGAEVGGQLYADALGREGSPGETYLGALAHDADTLARGFSGGERGCPAA